MRDGGFLVTGGLDAENVSGVARIWNESTERWIDAPRLGQGRYLHAATLLRDGRVLVAGGLVTVAGRGPEALRSAEVYDPVANAWAPTGELGEARCEHSLTTLPDGSVLAIGGYADGVRLLDSVERWDPESGRWTRTGATKSPSSPVHQHRAMTRARRRDSTHGDEQPRARIE